MFNQQRQLVSMVSMLIKPAAFPYVNWPYLALVITVEKNAFNTTFTTWSNDDLEQ